MARIARFVVLASLLLTTHAFAAPTPAHLWSRGLGGSAFNPDGAFAVTVDAYRNVIVVGSFDGTVNFGGSDLVSLGNGDIFIAKYSPTGVHLWSRRFGNSSPDGALAVAADSFGDIFVTGYFNGTVDFGTGVNFTSSGQDLFIAKYTPGGTAVWARRVGGIGFDQGNGLVLDGANFVLITGYFQNSVDFGNSVATVSQGLNDAFVARYDANSSTLSWVRAFGNASTDVGSAIGVDASSNVYATGYFNTSINPGTLLTSAGSDDVYLIKYNGGGTHQWSQRFGGTASDQANGLAVDGSSNVIICGLFNNSVNFGGSTLNTAGFNDIFLAKYNTSGTHQWSEAFGSASGETALGVGADLAGNIALTGFFNASVNLGGATLNTSGLSDGFIARYNSAGVHQWSRKIGGTSNDDARCAAVDGAGNVVVVGRFQNGADFGGGGVWSNGNYDGFVAKYGATGAEPAISSIVDIGNDQGRKVKITFAGSGGDNADAALPVNAYEAYRRSDAAPAATAARAGSGPEGLSRRQLLDSGWTYAGSVPSHQKATYSIDAPTIGDSTVALGQYYSVFLIRAATDAVATFYNSAPDSGYSVDNLAPGVPSSFVYTAGNLTWNQSTAADFDYFSVYGSNTSSFGAATLVNYTVGTNMNVNASPYVYYFVTATDFSGNEGKPAVVNTLSGVGRTPQSYVLSVTNYPNPFNPRTTVKYTVPARGRVKVAVYDASGAHVATLFDGERTAGAYSIEWDGRAENGDAVASRLYFVRIDQGGATRTRKMVLLK